MVVIRSIREVTSIKKGPLSEILPDGTILNPEPYHAVDITFDDGVVVQIERPLTKQKVIDARKSGSKAAVDGISVGDVI